jgi:spermidine/putrescine transport system ATP-binding protein
MSTDDHARQGGALRIIGLSKRFDRTWAVDGVDLDVRPGEFFSLLGPSGCGKTTLLRMIAGLEHPTSGHVTLDGHDLTRLPAHVRTVNTVFQNYALFPHLDVFENVAFGLRRQHVRRAELRRRVQEALELVRLAEFARRRPVTLSGGQQQRVALARALVLRPSVLLLDEPLGSLDAKLRKQLQTELTTLQQQVGITFVLVTHDQEEALGLSDRIGVMHAGQIVQVGTPHTIYNEPATPFVADFLGVSNLLTAEVAADGVLRIGEFPLRVTAEVRPGRATVMMRPERVEIEPYHEGGGENLLPAMVERVVNAGPATRVMTRLATGATLEVLVHNNGAAFAYPQGTPVQVRVPSAAVRVWPCGEENQPTGDKRADSVH